MKTLFLDLSRGAAGDMLTAALYGLLSSKEQSEFIAKMNSLKEGVEVKAYSVLRSGIGSIKIDVLVDGKKEGEDDGKKTKKAGKEVKLSDIEAIVDTFDVSDTVKNDVKGIYGSIASAESKAHSEPVSKIHFHEVGMMDAIFDITGTAVLIEMLGPEKIAASPVCTGYGTVHCFHGTLPVPTPATSELLTKIPVTSGDVEGELCTPTGAALVAYYVQDFGKMPDMVIDRTAYGAGTKEFSDIPSILRAVIGDAKEGTESVSSFDRYGGKYTDTVIQLSFNVDDMTGEDLSYACNRIRRAGAREVFTQAVTMKKGRPGVLVTVLCDAEMEDEIVHLIFKHTSTIGIRRQVCDRIILDRKINEEFVDDRIIRVKNAHGYEVRKSKPEFEDLKALADETGESLEEIRRRLFQR